MSAILALVTVTVLIVIGMLRKKQPEKRIQEVLVKRYVHPGHTWARLTEDGDVLVGMDDFAQSLIGIVDDVKLPRLLTRVRQGSVGWHVWHNHRLIPMVSPVDGWVIEKNEMVLNNPSLVNAAPYGDGWLIRVRPRRLSFQLNNLLTGRAVQQWQDAARAQLARMFTGTPALMYQDGGVLIKNLSDRCSEQEWKAIVQEFLLAGE